MRHAVLGVGGVGGLIAVALAKQGEDVTLILRPEAMDAYPRTLNLESPFGNFSVDVNKQVMLDSSVDVLWVAVKATQLDAALQRVPPNCQIESILPLLNGVDHIRYLRKLYGEAVVPATIGVESERVAPGRIVHLSPFARLNVASIGERRLSPVVEKLAAFGFECRFVPHETTMLWSKLVFLAPVALVTAASGLTIDGVLTEERWRALLESCVCEASAVANAAGARVDANLVLASIASMPKNMRTSMQKDVAAGRQPELDAIAGPIIRGAEAFGLSAASTREAVDIVQRFVGS